MNVAIVLNWKAGQETVSCVASIFNKCVTIDFVVIVDNCSGDDSVEVITDWLSTQSTDLKRKVKFIKSAANSGYAGGNNLGIKWCNDCLDYKNIWIVNNDTYFRDDAFSPMLEILNDSVNTIVGSVIVQADTNKLECYGGGKIFPILGKAKLFKKGGSISSVSRIDGLPDYIMGCSMAFSKTFVDDVGLMDERYFMYWEEVDWQTRGRDQGYKLAVSKNSVVYHKGSFSTGGRGTFYYYYVTRAAIIYNKKFYGFLFSMISCIFLISVIGIKEYRNPRILHAAVRGAVAGLLRSSSRKNV